MQRPVKNPWSNFTTSISTFAVFISSQIFALAYILLISRTLYKTVTHNHRFFFVYIVYGKPFPGLSFSYQWKSIIFNAQFTITVLSPRCRSVEMAGEHVRLKHGFPAPQGQERRRMNDYRGLAWYSLHATVARETFARGPLAHQIQKYSSSEHEATNARHGTSLLQHFLQRAKHKITPWHLEPLLYWIGSCISIPHRILLMVRS